MEVFLTCMWCRGAGEEVPFIRYSALILVSHLSTSFPNQFLSSAIRFHYPQHSFLGDSFFGNTYAFQAWRENKGGFGMVKREGYNVVQSSLALFRK